MLRWDCWLLIDKGCLFGGHVCNFFFNAVPRPGCTPRPLAKLITLQPQSHSVQAQIGSADHPSKLAVNLHLGEWIGFNFQRVPTNST